jgi:TonB family protein
MIVVTAVSFLSVSIAFGQNDAPAVSPNRIIEGQQDQGKEIVTSSVTASSAPKYVGIYHPGINGVTIPQVIYSVSPEFSDEARAKHYQGSVLVSLIIGADGLPKNPRVVRALGMGLDEKAIGAVKQYRFKPAEKDGTPVPVQMNVEVHFVLAE